MQITVTFDSMEEFETFRGGQPAVSESVRTAPALFEEPVLVSVPGPETEAAAAPKAEEPVADEELRVMVRKELAALNKQLGHNVAKELISKFGVSRLTDVRLEDLPALRKMAKEAADA